jgi:predicted HTH transcriptional regulator
MTAPGLEFDVTPFLHQDEGQNFDRKSLFHGPPESKKPRDRKEVRDQVARWVAGFANAEGGVLILGIEDDHSITGHQLPPAELQTLLSVPQARCEPPQPPGFVVPHDCHELVLRQAAELLFARLGPDHPNAGVRVFHVVGTERSLGATHNVEERPRIEGNLPEVWQEAVSVIGGLMRQPSRLVGNRFQAVSEYPRFSWQEALLNAIAHRDYSLQGNCIEVWLFDDRMEVLSPGGLLPELNLQELLSRKRVHCSRNPRLMRTLVDLGLTRDQGEGIPRMFAEMEDAFLPAPRIEPTARNVSVVLGNTTTLTEADRTFVERLAAEELTQEEFRALLAGDRPGQGNLGLDRGPHCQERSPLGLTHPPGGQTDDHETDL